MADRKIEINLVEAEDLFNRYWEQHLKWVRAGYEVLIRDLQGLRHEEKVKYIISYLDRLIDQEILNGQTVPRFVKMRWVEYMAEKLENK